MSRLFQSTKAHEARAQVAQEQRRALASRSVSPVPPMHFGHQPSASANASNMTLLHTQSTDTHRRSSAPSRSSLFCTRSSHFQDSRNTSVSERQTHHVTADDKENDGPSSSRIRGKRMRDGDERDSSCSSTPNRSRGGANRGRCEPRASRFSSPPSRSPVMVSSRLLELAQPRRLNVVPGNRMKLPSPPPRKISPPAKEVMKKRINTRKRVGDAPFLPLPLDTEESPAGCSPTGLRSTAPPRQEVSSQHIPAQEGHEEEELDDVCSASDPSPSPAVAVNDSMFAAEETSSGGENTSAAISKQEVRDEEGNETANRDITRGDSSDAGRLSDFCQPPKTLQEARLLITPEDRVRLSLMVTSARCGRGSDVTVSPMSEGERLSLFSPSSRVKTSQELRCSSALDDPVLRSTIIEIRNSIQMASPRPPLAPPTLTAVVPCATAPANGGGLCGDWPTEMFSHHFPQNESSPRGSHGNATQSDSLGVSSVMYCTADMSLQSQGSNNNNTVVRSSLQSLEDQYKDLEREWQSLNSTTAVSDCDSTAIRAAAVTTDSQCSASAILPSSSGFDHRTATNIEDVSSMTCSSDAMSNVLASPPLDVAMMAPTLIRPLTTAESAKVNDSAELVLEHLPSGRAQQCLTKSCSASHSKRCGERSTLMSKAQSRADAPESFGIGAMTSVTEAHDCLAVVAERLGFDLRRAMMSTTLPLLLCSGDALDVLHNAHARLQGALLLRSVPADAARAMRTAVSDIGRALQIIESTRPCAPLPVGGNDCLMPSASSLDWQSARPVESGAAIGSAVNSKSGSAVRVLSPVPQPPRRMGDPTSEARLPQQHRLSPTLISSSADGEEESDGAPLHLPSEPHIPTNRTRPF